MSFVTSLPSESLFPPKVGLAILSPHFLLLPLPNTVLIIGEATVQSFAPLSKIDLASLYRTEARRHGNDMLQFKMIAICCLTSSRFFLGCLQLATGIKVEVSTFHEWLLKFSGKYSKLSCDYYIAKSVSHGIVCVGVEIFLILLSTAGAFLASTLGRFVMLADFTGADVKFEWRVH